MHKLLAGVKPYLPGLTLTILLQKNLFYFNRFEKQMDPTKVKYLHKLGILWILKSLNRYTGPESRCCITHAFRGHFRSVLIILRCCLSEHSR